eukprot:1977049-Rhodomonas_salina.1
MQSGTLRAQSVLGPGFKGFDLPAVRSLLRLRHLAPPPARDPAGSIPNHAHCTGKRAGRD